MIFVTLGTQNMPFLRILEAFESFYIKQGLKEQVIVQSGFTPFTSNLFEVVDFLNPSLFEQYMNEANWVITHGGAGSIFAALHHHKKIIVMPRLSKYGEHNDDHQMELVDHLSKLGHLLAVHEDFDEVALDWLTFNPVPYHTNNQMVSLIKSFIGGDTNE